MKHRSCEGRRRCAFDPQREEREQDPHELYLVDGENVIVCDERLDDGGLIRNVRFLREEKGQDNKENVSARNFALTPSILELR